MACRYFNTTAIRDQDTRTISTSTAKYSPRHWAHTVGPQPIPPCAGVVALDESEYQPSDPDPRTCLSRSDNFHAPLELQSGTMGITATLKKGSGLHPFGNQMPPLGQAFAAVQGAGGEALKTIKNDKSRSVFLLTQDQTLNQPTPAQQSPCDEWSDSGDDISAPCCNDTSMTWANVKSCSKSNAGDDSTNGLKADLIFWRIGADNYVPGGPVDHTHTRDIPSIEPNVVGQAQSAFYTTPDQSYVEGTRYMPGT